MWRHWSSSGLLASLPAAAAAAAAVARADFFPLYTGWTVTSTGEEVVEGEREKEGEREREREGDRESTQRGRKRCNCHRICMSAAMYWELPPRQGQS